MQCALLGTGRQANRLSNAIRLSGSTVSHVLSRTQDSGQAFCKQNAMENTTQENTALENTIVSTDLDGILEDPSIDAVVITTPDFLHYEQASKSLMAGKNVFLEKPISICVPTAEKLRDIAAEKNLTLAVDYHMRFSPAVQFLKDLIQQTYFGDIKKISISMGWKPNTLDGWRSNKNPWWLLSLLGTHCIDLALWMLVPVYGPLAFFQGTKSNFLHHQLNEDEIDLHMQFERIKDVSISCHLKEFSPLTISIESSKGSFTFDQLLGEKHQIVLQDHIYKFDYKNPWLAAFTAFKDSVSSRTPFPIDVDDTIQNVFLMNQVKRISSEKRD